MRTMIGAFTVGKKMLLFGYKRYGVPGAIVSGAIFVAGYVAVRRALSGGANADSLDEALEAELGPTDESDDSDLDDSPDDSSASN
ncbi:hypothetical protein C491_09499 [Natronococcus amylolyticus DSM 10524]|uniref:Uncharacterized protein n=2 Tax=Natronococcus amylolyticus TaxID=44470 RepID=L9X8G7_9EURY|nr:hypothetical protein C491_09499 [Natronococcus amylolyticus DSM 10524]